jgi:hypothetical protein
MRWTADGVLHTGVQADGEERACCQAERQEGALLYSCGVGDNTGEGGWRGGEVQQGRECAGRVVTGVMCGWRGGEEPRWGEGGGT